MRERARETNRIAGGVELALFTSEGKGKVTIQEACHILSHLLVEMHHHLTIGPVACVRRGYSGGTAVQVRRDEGRGRSCAANVPVPKVHKLLLETSVERALEADRCKSVPGSQMQQTHQSCKPVERQSRRSRGRSRSKGCRK